jgi:hypothetical protein
MATEQESQLYPAAKAAALALPPLTPEAIAAIARILAGIEARRDQAPAPAQHQPAA